MMHRTKKQQARTGFSLLEVMLVVVIIGALMAIVAWNMTGQGERAKRRVTMANMTMIQKALRLYQLNNNMYPATLDALVTGSMPYLSEDNALADGWGRAFLYQTPGSNDRPFDLISYGSDGQYLTEDDLNIWALPSE